MTDFVNEPLEVASLPRLGGDDFVPVDPNWIRVSLIGTGLFGALVLIAGVVVALVVEFNWILAAIVAALVALTGLFAIARVVEVRNIAYQVRQHDLSYRSGVLTKRVATVPFVRVQHARISQGPVERRFGISTLEVNSAGPDLHIHGLASADAERLKALVVERAGDLVEDS